ncbi:MAG: peroxiredoxin [Sphingobacteriales bacterium]|jgi:peroxiredoxin
MAATESTMMDLGTTAPDFKLLDVVKGEKVSLGSLKGIEATVVLFICNHCPFVKHINKSLVAISNAFIPKGVSFIAISSNDVANYPEDSPEKMAEVAKKEGYAFPYLYDESQDVAKSYGAVCTPDLFVFDKNLKCLYRGQFDLSTPGNGIEVSGDSLKNALSAHLEEGEIIENQLPSIGCGIKWK